MSQIINDAGLKPISVSVASRTEFVNEKEVKGKFGFTFDVSKALKAFRDGFQARE